MRKLFLMILLIAGASFSADAQICHITKGVEVTGMSSGSNPGELNVTLSNTNDYKVTVDIQVTVVDVHDNNVDRTKTVVISANKEKKVLFRGKKVKDADYSSGYNKTDANESQVKSLIVSKCD